MFLCFYVSTTYISTVILCTNLLIFIKFICILKNLTYSKANNNIANIFWNGPINPFRKA